MKNKILFIFISVFLLLVGTNKVEATVILENEDYTIDEQFIYNDLNLKYDNFNFNEKNQGFCRAMHDNSHNFYVECSFVSFDEILNSTYKSYLSVFKTLTFNFNADVDVYHYYFYYDGPKKDTSELIIENATSYIIYNGMFTSFDLPSPDEPNIQSFTSSNSTRLNSLNFIEYFSPEPEDPEPEEYLIENKIYLPIELEENMCPYILDKDTIRVYDEEPTENSTITYTDYFINSHYISKSGSETFENDVLMCLDKSKFTTAFYYRFDFDKIMIIFISMLTIVYVIFGKIIHSFFIGFRR